MIHKILREFTTFKISMGPLVININMGTKDGGVESTKGSAGPHKGRQEV